MCSFLTGGRRLEAASISWQFARTRLLQRYRVSVGGRVYLTRRNQLKLVGTRRNRHGLIFAREEERSVNRKRARDDDDDESVDDDASGFLGFAADSFIYRGTSDDHPMVCDSEGGGTSACLPPEEVDPQEGPSTRQWSQSNQSSSSSCHPKSLRRSSRPKRHKRDVDFIY
ncbi:uncharacterized protein LOC129717189 [Wyeomyia smithii]|uniref:uncharacterized protein LOC129717189 n=1 Tax=Wyeomyia smithii TaxID=174621 RepID=UPI002467DFB5|nr:uncharacterized protein LOC129717189 [Wyeomyia smithii]